MQKLSGIKRIFMGMLVVMAIAGGMAAAAWTNFYNNSSSLAFDAPDQPSLFVIGPDADQDRVVIRRGKSEPCEEQQTAYFSNAHFVHVDKKQNSYVVEKHVQGDSVVVTVRDARGNIVEHRAHKLSSQHEARDGSNTKQDLQRNNDREEEERKNPVKTFFKALKVVLATVDAVVDLLIFVNSAR